MASFLDLLDQLSGVALNRVTLDAGEQLFVEGDQGESMYVVESGRLQAFIEDENGEEVSVGSINIGDPVGEMQVLTGGHRTATVLALEAASLRELPAGLIQQWRTEKHPAYLKLEKLIIHRLHRNHLLMLLPELFGTLNEEALVKLEETLEWVKLQRGDRLISQGDIGEAMYVVVSGRLQVSVTDKDGLDSPILQISRGETVGEMSLFTDDLRTAHVDALRDTLLVKLTKQAFATHIAHYPKLHHHVTQVMMRRLQQAARPNKDANTFSNITIIPLHDAGAAKSLVAGLVAHLKAWGKVLYLSRASVAQLTAIPTDEAALDDHANVLRLSTWLDVQEQHHRFIVMEAEIKPCKWNELVLQYADRALLVGNAGAQAALDVVEQSYQRELSGVPQDLILMHDENAKLYNRTEQWLALRDVNRHFHVRNGHKEDLGRVARFISGHAVGLVLGGGGARGFAHIGILKAFRELGIPIDMVGGTSMGAVIAGQVAMELDVDEIIHRSRRAFVDEKPFRKQLLPIFSFYKSKKLNEVTHQILYQDSCIEDLWMPCFIVSCSLGTAELVVHEQGKTWEAVRASTALPGIVTPVSYQDLLHVDGGLMNNLPVDLMQARCPGELVAVEASDLVDLNTATLEEPSIYAYLKNKWLRRNGHPQYPIILEILMRSLLLGSVQNVKRAREQADLLLTPPIKTFGLLEFEAIEEIAEIGYRYALEALQVHWNKGVFEKN